MKMLTGLLIIAVLLLPSNNVTEEDLTFYEYQRQLLPILSTDHRF